MKMTLPEATKNEYLIQNAPFWIWINEYLIQNAPLSKNEYLIQNPPSRFK